MDHFQYKKGGLHAEDVPLARIAAEVGTPVYVYSTATLCRHYQIFDEALSGTDHLTCFAVKANSNLSVLASLARLGCGADVVSGGELARALAAGIPARRIVFPGWGNCRRKWMRPLMRASTNSMWNRNPSLKPCRRWPVPRG
ncbi:hypothetical protein JCM17846_31500 [Iodidimonas nitroreducens]|uniref:Orn/DAP/Arg decarboxylase 2 N-terminal domain-containing protein n=1 Tax=Iodidimonas nitroreducens TaxID=1236968 RepID=A0A5A7NBI4_9PROT|nr:hypothetical protein JCM17846_31500 [Iodidimonas nitroreducens]